MRTASTKRSPQSMKYRINTDPFFDKQPKKDFVTYLTQPMHIAAPSHWNISRSMKGNEAYMLNSALVTEFPDNEKLLETINTDFRQFLNFCGDQSGTYKIRTVKKETECFEAYEINVTENECLVCANDTEGIRRGLIFLEDEMCRNGGPFLPLGVIKRKPHVKSRISRSFFAPATHYGESEELADDCDYYPENYLNRLMHDGINGLWIFVHFKTLLPSAIVPEYGENHRKLIQKLNKIVDKCMKYGIKIYALGTEPASTFQNEVLHNHPEMLGASFLPDNSAKAVCVSKEAGAAYIKEAITNLFTLSPRLSGLITISVGESVASCAAVEEHGDDIFCLHCKALGLDKPLALVKYEEIISSTLKNIKPDAEFISWTYAHRGWSTDMVKKYLTSRSRDTILMENFEDWGEVIQLGKPHTARDYWLSYSGPGELFRMASEASAVNKTPLYAKIQVCCSHELASVPYIPAPGKLYDKFKYMYENGIEGAVFCWYFGNYPSLMNKAACELSFFDFSQEKVHFLDYIAKIFWGNESEIITKAWQIFEEAYSNFPVNVAFTWFGPMTDSIVWPLHLEPIDMPVSSNWLLQDMVGGDRIGECIAMGHTLSDAISLCEKMASEFETGLSLLESANIDDPNREEQLSVARAIAILFRSGTNILNFYKLRNEFGYENSSDKNKILLKMRQIVCHEKEL